MMNDEDIKITMSVANDLVKSFMKSRISTISNLKKEFDFYRECNIVVSTYLTGLVNTLMFVASGDEDASHFMKEFTQKLIKAIKEGIPGEHVFEMKNIH